MIDYESRENCFAKCAYVQSRLVYGDPDVIPQPWLTVLVPTYRRTMLLKEALSSIIDQWHTDFSWDIVVLDNEPDDGEENETERLIRKLDNKRILYYRNSEHIRPGDNFNRGFLLARGKWVMMLHDDDLLILNTMQTMGRLIRAYDTPEQPLGAIAASYVQVEYDPARNEIKADIPGLNNYWCNQPHNYLLYQLTHSNVKVLAHIGGTAPTNGSTFLRTAVIEAGGFNEDYGISGDLILFYNIESKYNVYQTTFPLGFYRWGSNGMINSKSTYHVIRDGYDFREYIYAKKENHLIGRLFRNCHYRKFSTDAVHEHNNVSRDQLTLSDFDEIYSKRPNPIWYIFYKGIISRIYGRYKHYQGKRNARLAMKRLNSTSQ